jgi:hypothetical protein
MVGERVRDSDARPRTVRGRLLGQVHARVVGDRRQPLASAPISTAKTAPHLSNMKSPRRPTAEITIEELKMDNGPAETDADKPL